MHWSNPVDVPIAREEDINDPNWLPPAALKSKMDSPGDLD
jgi:hypothetical protein